MPAQNSSFPRDVLFGEDVLSSCALSTPLRGNDVCSQLRSLVRKVAYSFITKSPDLLTLGSRCPYQSATRRSSPGSHLWQLQTGGKPLLFAAYDVIAGDKIETTVELNYCVTQVPAEWIVPSNVKYEPPPQAAGVDEGQCSQVLAAVNLNLLWSRSSPSLPSRETGC